MARPKHWLYEGAPPFKLSKEVKPKRRAKDHLSKEEKEWVRKYRVFIIDQGDPGFVDQKYGDKLNGAASTLLRVYKRDLKFPKPRSFSISKWMENGIYCTKDKGWDTWRKIRVMSVVRRRAVFVLWGHDVQHLEKVIEPGRGHLIVKYYYPLITRYNRKWLKYKPFSTIADWMGVSREIWRL